MQAETKAVPEEITGGICVIQLTTLCFIYSESIMSEDLTLNENVFV